MTFPGMLKMAVVAAIGVTGSAVGASEPASFMERVMQRQGITPSGAGTGKVTASAASTQRSYGEPASFIARVEKSQGIRSVATAEREDPLSPEQIRLVQRALTARGHATPVSGKFDERTRSALMSFQRSQSLPVSGTLDSRTVDALGFAPTQVTPVRGPSDDDR